MDVAPVRPVRFSIAAGQLVSLYVLSALMLDCPYENDIITLVTCAVPMCGPCDLAAVYLVRNQKLVRSSAGWLSAARELDDQVVALAGADGQVTLPGRAWSGALALRGPDGPRGYLVLSAPLVPSLDALLRLRLLTQQAGAAIATVALRRGELERARQLRLLDQQLAEAQDRLTATIAEQERQTTIRRTLARSTCEQAIADAVHDLTGLAVAIEDPFGNPRFWSGPQPDRGYPKPESGRRDEMLRQAVRQGGPVRDKGVVLAVARPRRETLGTMVLVGAERGVGPQEMFALEEGVLALGQVLAHRRDLVDLESRLRGDLVHDLVTGGDPDGAIARAEAVGHDLHVPHQVVVIDWPDMARVLDTATRAAHALGVSHLLGRRFEAVVVVAASPVPAYKLYDLLCRELGPAGGAVGVGGRADSPAQLPRSFNEAAQALEIRRDSRSPDGLAVFDELGLYRVLHAGQHSADIERYVWEWLGPLLEYDYRHHTELTNTLFQYLECGGNYTSTADTLRIHRSTLRYRLRRIRDIGHVDFHDVDNRLNLHVAARAWHMLTGSGSPNGRRDPPGRRSAPTDGSRTLPPG
ncbi:MAG TPA: helix-turn-helix domain-containing protein [Pseudonocardiaceae bacterium]|jgi:hypothetical protein